MVAEIPGGGLGDDDDEIGAVPTALDDGGVALVDERQGLLEGLEAGRLFGGVLVPMRAGKAGAPEGGSAFHNLSQQIAQTGQHAPPE